MDGRAGSCSRMASAGQEDLSDLQLNCEDGHKALTQEEDDDDDDAAGPDTEPSQHVVEPQTLFLSRMKMNEIPESVLTNTTLKVSFGFHCRCSP